MNKAKIVAAIVAFLSIHSLAFAHDAKLHKGKPLQGVAVSISAAEFKVKTGPKETVVQIIKGTQFELGEEGTKSSVQELHEGASVKVYGTKLESGVLVAKEVIISSGAAANSHEQHAHGTKSH